MIYDLILLNNIIKKIACTNLEFKKLFNISPNLSKNNLESGKFQVVSNTSLKSLDLEGVYSQKQEVQAIAGALKTNIEIAESFSIYNKK